MVIKGTRPRSEVIGLVIFFGIHCIVSLYHCISAAYIKDITIGQMSLVTVVTSSEWFYKLAFKVRFILTQEQLSLNPRKSPLHKRVNRGKGRGAGGGGEGVVWSHFHYT